jgi:signal peptidase I
MRKALRFLLWTAILLGALVAGLRYFAIRWWRLPDNDPFLEASIAPSLRGGDLVILWRLTKPSFGNLVLCPEPGAPHRVVIGRIAGEGGDDLKIVDGGLTVNRSSAATERSCGRFTVIDPSTSREVDQRCDIEVLAGTGHMRGGISGEKRAPKPAEYTVPEGQVFLLSDNRLFPYDSRDFGFVDRAACKETVVFRLAGKAGFSDQESRFTFIH